MFKFKLQSVLEYRQNVEEKILNDYSELRRRLETEKELLKKLIAEREGLTNELRQMKNTLLRAQDIASMVAYVEAIRKKQHEQENLIHEVKGLVEDKRKELVEAVKNRKVMENLKERQAEEYRKNTSDLEQKNSDEMAILKFGRRET
ncbi:MAG: flagellar export protein FliJ [Smithellaceae bacterium]